MAIPYSRTVAGNLPWYSVLIVVGIALAVWLAGREECRLGLPRDTSIDLALVVVPCGIVGARLYYVAMSWEQFAAHPVTALYIWQGGIAIYGAVIGGAVGGWFYARHKKLSFLQLADIVAPGLLLAQAIGRWGNYFNMEAYGPVITDARLQFFPLAVLIPQGGEYVWHAATFFYESVWNACGFAALWNLRRHTRRKGETFAWYLLLYGSGRFIIEQLRQDSLYLGTLRVSQWLSLLLCAAACIYLLSGQSFRRSALSLFCASLWLLRWFSLSNDTAYAGLIFIPGLCAIWLIRRSRPALLCLLTALFLDTAGLMLAAVLYPFHVLLCSVTLPISIFAVWQTKTDIKEDSPCPQAP